MKLSFTKKELKKWHVALIVLALFIGGTFLYSNFILVQNVFDHMYYANAYPKVTGKIYPPFLGLIQKKNQQIEYSRPGGGVDNIGRLPFYERAEYNPRYFYSPYYLPNEELRLEFASPLNSFYEIESYDIATYGSLHIYYTTKREYIDEPYRDVFEIRYDYNVEEKSLKESITCRREFGTIVNKEVGTIVDGEARIIEQGVFERDLTIDSILYKDNEVRDFIQNFGLSINHIDGLRDWVLYDKVLADWFTHNKFNTRFSLDNLGKVEIEWR